MKLKSVRWNLTMVRDRATVGCFFRKTPNPHLAQLCVCYGFDLAFLLFDVLSSKTQSRLWNFQIFMSCWIYWCVAQFCYQRVMEWIPLNSMANWKCSMCASACSPEEKSLTSSFQTLLIRFHIRQIPTGKQGISQMVNYRSLFSPVWLGAGGAMRWEEVIRS